MLTHEYVGVTLREALAEWKVCLDFTFDREAVIQQYASEAIAISTQFGFEVAGEGLNLLAHPIIWYTLFK